LQLPIGWEDPNRLGEKDAAGRAVGSEQGFMKPFTVKGFRPFIFSPEKTGTAIGYTGTYKIEINMNRPLSKTDFTKEVIESTNLSLVQFKKEWNGASQIIEPVYNELANSYNGVVNFFTVDVEIEKGLDSEYGVMDIPTILFFKKGRIIDHAVGLIPKNVLISKIENAIESTRH
jgi:thioredoxin 1